MAACPPWVLTEGEPEPRETQGGGVHVRRESSRRARTRLCATRWRRRGQQGARVRVRRVQRGVPEREAVRQRRARRAVPTARAGTHLHRAGVRAGAVRPAVPLQRPRAAEARGEGHGVQEAAGEGPQGRRALPRPKARMNLLTAAEMRAVDEATIAGGTPGEVLMERAGQGVAGALERAWGSPLALRVLVLAA